MHRSPPPIRYYREGRARDALTFKPPDNAMPAPMASPANAIARAINHILRSAVLNTRPLRGSGEAVTVGGSSALIWRQLCEGLLGDKVGHAAHHFFQVDKFARIKAGDKLVPVEKRYLPIRVELTEDQPEWTALECSRQIWKSCTVLHGSVLADSARQFRAYDRVLQQRACQHLPGYKDRRYPPSNMQP
jgi:hypothetical protein